jgi:hypothetical protein
LKDELQRITEQILRDKIIRHSNSPWNAPVILVRKKEDSSKKEKWRLVVDFRRLNEVTVGDSCPLPLISDILGALGKARYYTTVDLASGFDGVAMDERKTAAIKNYPVPTNKAAEGVPRTSRILQKVRTAVQLDRQSLT